MDKLTAEERRLTNFVEFIGEGRGNRTLAQALVESERKVDALKGELVRLQRSRAQVFQAPPIEWIQERVFKLQEVLERTPDRSGVLLRNLLGPLRLVPTRGDIGRPYYRPTRTSTRSRYWRRRVIPAPARRVVRILHNGGPDRKEFEPRLRFPSRFRCSKRLRHHFISGSPPERYNCDS